MKRKRESDSDVPKVQKDNNLPVLQRSAQILSALSKNDVLIVIASTGSGKTTQIPQLILDSNSSSSIVVTQPRRIAAMTVAARVAAERNVKLGEHVGYAVRFDDRSQRGLTQIRYVTDGVLLREALVDGTPGLRKRYSHIIIDEVHERSVNTDVVLGVVRQILAHPPPESAVPKTGIMAKFRSKLPFKVVIMSATTDERKLVHFFQNNTKLSVGTLNVSGRLHPVRVLFATTLLDDYVHAAVDTIVRVHREEAPGDVLAFLSGVEDITSAISILNDRARRLLGTDFASTIVPLPLYASLPPAEQIRAIDPLPEINKGEQPRRKVIFATNVAETSITIPGIKYVVDCGVVKVRDIRNEHNFSGNVLRVQAVSKAQADQRKGRAGRTGPGSVYRLYTEEQFNKMENYPKPEILRVEAASTLLQIIALTNSAKRRRLLSDGKGVENGKNNDESDVTEFLKFPLLDKIPRKVMERSLETLCVLGALDMSMRLTEAGVLMSRIPTGPMLARSLLEALRVGCMDLMLSVAAILSVEGSIFIVPHAKQDQAKTAHRRFLEPHGDHLTMVNALNAFMELEGVSRQREFCRDHFLNMRTLASATSVRGQLLKIMDHTDMVSWALKNPLAVEVMADIEEATMEDLVRRCLVAGYFRNVARKRGEDGKYVTIGQKGAQTGNATVDIHPSSALRSLRKRRNPPLLLYDEVVLTSKVYMRTVVAIELRWLMQHTKYYKRAGIAAVE